MTNLRLRAALAGFVAALLLLSSETVSADPDWGKIDAMMHTEYPDDGPGAVVIAAVDGKIVHAKAFGLASMELAVPLTPDSVVRIASLTKQFTSVAILKLVESHKLQLDDRLGMLWPECSVRWRAITLRQLLSQTSGLTDDLAPLYSHIATDMTVDELLGVYANLPLVAAPGSKWRYSNVNYWILGKIIEIFGGTSYADFVTHNVLVPTMSHTRYGDHDPIIIGRASGYEPAPKGGWINARYFSSTLGYSAGGFVSTPKDMATWYAALGRGEIIPRKLLALALQEQKTDAGKPTGYALGWYVMHADGELVAHHGGSSFGFESYVYWMPSRGLFAGVFKNCSDARGEPTREARMILDALVGH